MAVGNALFFNLHTKYLWMGQVDPDAIRVALVKSTWTPDQINNAVWADISAHEIANGGGYTTGGLLLANVNFTAVTLGHKFSSNNASWTASGGGIAAWRYAVFRYNATFGAIVDPLMCYLLGDDTPGDVPANTTVLTLACPAGGWGTLKRAA